MEKRTKESRKRINSLILLIAFTAIMLIVSTYAWFTTQKDITLSNLRGTVEVAENMEISLDAKTWSQEIDLSNAATTLATAQGSKESGITESNKPKIQGDAPIVTTELFPVSGYGALGITESYTIDSQSYTSSIMPLYKGEATGTSLKNISQCTEFNGTTAVDNGYFAFDIYIKNTARDGLDDTLQLNLNSAVQVLKGDGALLPGQTNEIVNKLVNGTNRDYKGNPDSGLQNTVRVGLALYGATASSTATQTQVLDATADATISDVAIWEPNAYDHVEYVHTNNNKYVNNGADIDDWGRTAAVATYALTDKAVGSTITNVYDIALATGSDAKTKETKTLQTKNQKDGDNKVTSYRIDTTETSGKPINITNVSGSEFKIGSNKISRLRVYVWLEGQDVDCINQASYGGGIEVDLGLTKDDFIGEVLSR